MSQLKYYIQTVRVYQDLLACLMQKNENFKGFLNSE